MDENAYANEAFSLVKKLTTALICYFIKTADGKLLMNVKDIKDFYKQTERCQKYCEELLGLAAEPYRHSGKPPVVGRNGGGAAKALMKKTPGGVHL